VTACGWIVKMLGQGKRLMGPTLVLRSSLHGVWSRVGPEPVRPTAGRGNLRAAHLEALLTLT
jgi:hypothetical protein